MNLFASSTSTSILFFCENRRGPIASKLEVIFIPRVNLPLFHSYIWYNISFSFSQNTHHHPLHIWTFDFYISFANDLFKFIIVTFRQTSTERDDHRPPRPSGAPRTSVFEKKTWESESVQSLKIEKWWIFPRVHFSLACQCFIIFWITTGFSAISYLSLNSSIETCVPSILSIVSRAWT